MDDRTNISLLLVIAMLALMMSACSGPQGAPNAPAESGPQAQRGAPSGPRQFGNMTDAQRQQMFAQMTQQAIDACSGKSEGDTCTMTSQRGDRSGNCTMRNATLQCNTSVGGRQRPPQPTS